MKEIESNNVVALSELDSKIEMKKYGVPVPGQGNAKSIDELDEILKYIKYPVVLKINSSEILHKSINLAILLKQVNVVPTDDIIGT